MNQSSDLVLFRNCADNIEASGLRALLEANGIYCVVQGEQHRSMLGALGAYVEVNVLVPQTELGHAATVVKEAEEAGADQVAEEEMEGESPTLRTSSDLDGLGVKAVDLPDDSEEARQDTRRAKGWLIIALFAGPGLVAILALLFYRS